MKKVSQIKLLIQQEEMNLFHQRRELECLHKNISYLDTIKIYKSINTIDPIRTMDIPFTNWLKDPNSFIQSKHQFNKINQIQSTRPIMDERNDQKEMKHSNHQTKQRHSDQRQLEIPLNNSLNTKMNNPYMQQNTQMMNQMNNQMSENDNRMRNRNTQSPFSMNQSKSPRSKVQIKEEKRKSDEAKKPKQQMKEEQQENVMRYDLLLVVLQNHKNIFKYVPTGTVGEEFSVRVEEGIFLNNVINDLKVEEQKQKGVKMVLKNSMKAYFDTVKMAGKSYFVVGSTRTENGDINFFRTKRDIKTNIKHEKDDDSMTCDDDNTM